MNELLTALLFIPAFHLTVGSAFQGEQAAPAQDIMATQATITPFLWFDDQAEAAMRYYLSVFEDGQVLAESRWGEGGPLPRGTLRTARFRIAGQELMVLNGGPTYRLDAAFSLMVSCEDQAEVDSYWGKLSEGGEPGRCGWLVDRFGLSWQVIQRALGEMLGDEDPAKAGRVAAAMMQMGKLDIAKLKQAYAGR